MTSIPQHVWSNRAHSDEIPTATSYFFGSQTLQ